MYQLIHGELWDFYGKPRTYVCITTNGFVKNDGTAVMGRGCAAEAARKESALPKLLGRLLQQHGNKIHVLVTDKMLTFPVKHVWWEKADLDLIKSSADQLLAIAQANPKYKFILPRPGCGNGRLEWKDVRKVLKHLPSNVWIISK